MFLAIDIETNGLPRGRALDDPAYPRMVEAAAVMFDDDGSVVSSFHSYVRPSDWSISRGAQKVHGISEIRAGKVGIDEVLVAVNLVHLSACCEAMVSYSTFDRDVVASALIRSGRPANKWNRPGLRWIDLQAISTPVVDERFDDGGQKWPTLSSAMTTIIGAAHDDAHTALGDAVAAMRLFIALRDRGLVSDMGNHTAGAPAQIIEGNSLNG